LRDAVADAALTERAKTLGLDLALSASPAEFRQMVQTEGAVWIRLLEQTGVKLD
jgi:tripartite-type tricarboxylate transporter receptor subunit TctC